MECRILGGPDEGPTLSLDHEQFAYAGKFVMSTTGKAIAESESGQVLAASAFDFDRTDPDGAWIRYVTTRRDRRGEGIGSELIDKTATFLLQEANYVKIAVNNPYAYEAAYKANFEFTGDQTGLAELVLRRPSGSSKTRYRDGLADFADRELLTDPEREFLSSRANASPPDSP